jgi:hypothetical protein
MLEIKKAKLSTSCSDVCVQRGGECGGQYQQQSEQSEQQQHQRADQQDINF